MRHPVPTHARTQAFAIVTEAGRINLAQSGETATLEGLEQALAAAVRLSSQVRDMRIALRQQINEAKRAERSRSALGPEIIDDRIAQMRRDERGFGLVIPAVTA